MNIIDKLKLNEMEAFARTHFIPVVQDSVADFLYQKIVELNPVNVLEIGTAIGYSGIVILNASQNIQLTTIELNAERASMAQENFSKYGVANRTKMLVGDAKHFLPKFKRKTFDFIFLDGPKGQYINYLPQLLRILKVGGIIFTDNVNYTKYITQNNFVPRKNRTIYKNLKKFTETILESEKLKTDLYSVADGIAIIKKLK